MPRLVLLLLCLLFAWRTSSAQSPSTQASNDVPAGCPVTIRYQATPFVPPKPYSQAAGDGSFWFGTDKLWTVLPIDGAWELGHYTPNDPTFRQKLFLWRQGYDWRTELRPNLKVIGRRLDAEADPLLVDRPTNVSSEPGGMLVGINFPTVGCWEITGRYRDDALTFVIWVTAGRNSCDPSTRLSPTHPVYAEATELAQTLNKSGIAVECILYSTMENMFEDQVGAAFFRTNDGDFEALFLPRSESWDRLTIIERREKIGYRYDFEGTPKSFTGDWEGKQMYFLKHGNQLLNSLERQTVTKLNAALQNE